MDRYVCAPLPGVRLVLGRRGRGWVRREKPRRVRGRRPSAGAGRRDSPQPAGRYL